MQSSRRHSISSIHRIPSPYRTSVFLRNLRLLLTVLCCAVTIGCANNTAGEPTKRIALTFDDAPRGNGPMFSGDERATHLIAQLQKADVETVAFFVKTDGMQNTAGRARIERYAAAGHLIGNHTHSHKWLKRTDTLAYLDDIDMAEQLLNGIDNRRPWFRFPYLDEGRPVEQRDQVRQSLNERGMINAYVTVDNYDWYLERKWQEAKNAGQSVDMDALRSIYVELLTGALHFYDDLAVEHLGRSPVHVLLLHENDIGALFIGDLVQALRADGWQIISPDVAYADPIVNIAPKTLLTGQGRVAGLAVDAGADPRTLRHFAIEETQIDERLEQLAVFTD